MQQQANDDDNNNTQLYLGTLAPDVAPRRGAVGYLRPVGAGRARVSQGVDAGRLPRARARGVGREHAGKVLARVAQHAGPSSNATYKSQHSDKDKTASLHL